MYFTAAYTSSVIKIMVSPLNQAPKTALPAFWGLLEVCQKELKVDELEQMKREGKGTKRRG